MDLTVLFKISYGLYIISSTKDGKYNGQIANTVFQVTSEPPRIAVCINKNNLTHEFIDNSKIFTVSILSKDTPMTFIGQFGFKSGRDIDKFQGVNYSIGDSKAPIIKDYTIGFIELKVINQMDVGTHTIFVGEIINCGKFNDEEPLTYAYYHEIKKGKSPKNAPTYIKENK
ncbi:MAG: flavin reductase family protein [Caldisericia bacterium]